MVAAPKSNEGPDKGEVIEFSKARRGKRTGVAVSIRKGKLLFLPVPRDSPEPARSMPDDSRAGESEGNGN